MIASVCLTAVAWAQGGPPTVGDLPAVSGPQAGGEFMQVSADGFALGSLTVRMGGVAAPGTVFSAPMGQTIIWNTPTAPVPGPTNVRFTQGAIDITKPNAYTYLKPLPGSVAPKQGAWYEAQTLTLTGSNFAPNQPATVVVEGEVGLPASVISSTEVRVDVPAGYVGGAGKLDLTVLQNGIPATGIDAWTSLPALSASVAGNVTSGGSLRFTVDSAKGGLAYVLAAPFDSPVPFVFPDVHYAYLLDLGTSITLGTGGLLSDPAVVVPFSGGVIPAGISVRVQALTAEFDGFEGYASLTNAITVTL
jgi:hypothetical protein